MANLKELKKSDHQRHLDAENHQGHENGGCGETASR